MLDIIAAAKLFLHVCGVSACPLIMMTLGFQTKELHHAWAEEGS